MNIMSYYYLGTGKCINCYNPDDVFACSAVPSSGGCCVNCWRSHWRYAAGTDENHPALPDASSHPAMAEPREECAACERPFVEDDDRWQQSIGLLRDGITEVAVHTMCLHPERSCTDCTTRYARIRYREFGRTDSVHRFSSDLFMYFENIDGDIYCTICAENFFEFNGTSRDDYFLCPSCDHLRPDSEMTDYAGETYCEGCYDNHTYSCNNCGETVWDDDDHDCSEDDDSLIHSYSYRPTPFFFGKGKYHFGFELEVEARNNSRYEGARIVADRLGSRVYIKDDGSLTDGFEIVTHPHTLENYQNEFEWKVLDVLRDDGYRSWNTTTCGLHVHVSRSAFGIGDPWDFFGTSNDVRSMRVLARQSHELRFMKLIYDNQRQVERISGRSGCTYASFTDKGNLVRKVKYGTQGNGRYSAINTENDATIEVRVFRGSLRKERVLSAIEFVHACVEYTRDVKVTSKNHALSWLKFTGYVSANAESYPNLVTIMSESFANDSTQDEN